MSNLPYTLSERTLTFSKNTLLFCKDIKVTPVTRPLIDQLVRAATSIGANYSEANNAASRADFRNKIFISKKEAAETKYWLELLEDIVDDKQRCIELQKECYSLLRTLQKIISTLKQREKSRP